MVDYYYCLGISYFYFFFILVVCFGFIYGYDVVDVICINFELGGEVGLCQLYQCLYVQGMGIVVDIVFNYMVVGYYNVWWQDVLCWGCYSCYVEWFDIYWDSFDLVLSGKVLLFFLG